MTIRVVQNAHTASYADPIEVTTEQPVTLTGREEIWDGHRWLWAVAEDGRAGWVPDSYVTGAAEKPVACCDYSAIELTCSAGETVAFLGQTHGWAWCRKSDGSEGWVPLKNLRERRNEPG
jgi:hypothetical protein